MTIGDILYAILIKPLELVFELVFAVSYDLLPDPAVNLVIMSLAINLLVLPLYRRADIIQAEAGSREKAIRPVVDHIKRTFKGDERVMMIQTLYRQQDYHPLSAMKSMISLILQIPFFIAAYQFLSHLPLLNGQSMGPIKDLAQPDGLITIGSLTINLLPVLMTVINIVSSEIYTRGRPFKDKIVLYLSAVVFLVLLYDSPSGLVFYWTFNNVFSLVKNLITKLIEKRPHKPASEKKENKVTGVVHSTFWLGASYLALLAGLLIPSGVISASAEDFINSIYVEDPVHYVIYTTLVAIGTFVVWVGMYYLLSGSFIKKAFAVVMFAGSVTATVNFMCFGIDKKGMLTPELAFDYWIRPDLTINLVTTVAAVSILLITLLIAKLSFRPLWVVLIAGIITLSIMGFINVRQIEVGYSDVSNRVRTDTMPEIRLSKTGKNVVVIMLDRANSSLVPYIFGEKPELESEFDGFTYYPNTISYGIATNFGTPTLYGGYDYTPTNMNSRSDLLLKDKQNEALLLMPLLFSKEGYHVVTIDPPYGNYGNISDLSVFDEYEDINAYNATGMFNPYGETSYGQLKKVRERNFFCYSIFKMSPSLLKPLFYDNGDYNSLGVVTMGFVADGFTFPQSCVNTSVAHGVSPYFMDYFTTLDSMSSFTKITDDEEGCFNMLDSLITHNFALLQEPGYTIEEDVDNTLFDQANADRFVIDGRRLNVDSNFQMMDYHINMAAYQSLARWFDMLRVNGVWDNTRIIIVADHGAEYWHFADMLLNSTGFDIEAVNPVLMVKEFNSTGFEVSQEFMTNADVPTIAMKGIVDEPVNPFTGNPVNDLNKHDGPQKILVSYNWYVTLNNGTGFEPGAWYSVHDNIFEQNNWEYLGDY